MRFALTAIGLICLAGIGYGQNKDNNLPYYEIPEYPEEYTAGSVVSRMLDGLGFRYYWATEGLRDVDLEYKPTEEARATMETIEHIYGLTNTILNTAIKKANIRGGEKEVLTFEEMRKATLENIKKSSEIFLVAEDMNDFNIVFSGSNGSTEFPLWNQINGPIADALWHCGQVVLLRRASGNPFNGKVNVLTGKVRE